jgi:prevent-host-death family protein
MARASAAGIRELKDNLSEYVRRAEAGERIAVTMHGRVVAQLGPADSAARGRRRTRLEQMIADGTARPPLKDGDLPEDWPTTTIRLPKGTAAALIDADRDED